MYYIIDDFENKTPSNISFDKILLNCGTYINVYLIESVHDLIQFIGYGKYKNSKVGGVYFRGQTSLYNGSMIPSLYRGRTSYNRLTSTYNKRINEIIKGKRIFEQYDRSVFDPLLQHYGVKTQYIDIVDNIWVALWFALYQSESVSVNSHEYVYFHRSNEEFSYIILIASDAKNETSRFGVYKGIDSTLIDLRKAIPSYFLRPHSQHAYMIKKNIEIPVDYSNLIVGIAKIPTQLAFEWLGNNEFLTVRSLFPAPFFDSGYRILLKSYPENDQGVVNQFGSIQIISD